MFERTFSVLCGLMISVSSKTWIPQLGTAEFPKTQDLSPFANKGDVYKFAEDVYYKALQPTKVKIDDIPNSYLWKQLMPGSLQLPKDPEKHSIAKVGEIFRDHETGDYYKSRCLPQENRIAELWKCLERYQITADWMGLMREDIGDTRLGDLAIPGSHDAGTAGINVDSYLVDTNFLYRLGDLVVPEVLVNWSLTQDDNLLVQLETGFRHFDLRVADCQSFNDTGSMFRWWHGMSGDLIDQDLQDIRDFAQTHPDEVMILDFQNFVRPAVGGTSEMLQRRKRDVSDIILGYLSEVMVPYGSVSDNPTINEILATGSNVITIMDEYDIRDMSDLYWPNFIMTGFSGVANPEDLAVHRSGKLQEYLVSYPDQVTELSGCFTPEERTVSAAMVRYYGDNPIIEDILERIAPGVANMEPDRMSYEGVFLSLLFSSRFGINTNGMYARYDDYYSNGASVHYRGVNDMFHFWLARPGLYKPNILYLDDTSVSSDAVTTAIAANLGEIPREAAISLQGNTRTGFYFWDNYTAYGGEEGLLCNTIEARLTIISEEYQIRNIFEAVYEFVMQEGQYPPDSYIEVQVSSTGTEDWYTLMTYNIQELIETHFDLYIRGDDLGGGSGFAYSSQQYNLYGDVCGSPPTEGFLDYIEW